MIPKLATVGGVTYLADVQFKDEELVHAMVLKANSDLGRVNQPSDIAAYVHAKRTIELPVIQFTADIEIQDLSDSDCAYFKYCLSLHTSCQKQATAELPARIQVLFSSMLGK